MIKSVKKRVDSFSIDIVNKRGLESLIRGRRRAWPGRCTQLGRMGSKRFYWLEAWIVSSSDPTSPNLLSDLLGGHLVEQEGCSGHY